MTGYGYKESRLFISKEEILKRISQEDIFKMILGYKPTEHSYVYSPFRKDKVPDCYFEWYKDNLYFIDWAEPITKRRHRDCFNMVQDHFQISFYKSLEIVNSYFKLNLLAGHHDDSEYVVNKKKEIQQRKAIIKSPKSMPFKARMFNGQEDRDFWQPFQITKSNLIEDNVFPIIWYKVYSKKIGTHIVIRPATRSYLVGNFNPRVKFYVPDKIGKGKWATNCIQNDIWGYDDLPIRGKQLIISKSYKDYRVLKNQGTTVIAFQNEGMLPSQKILQSLINRFEEIVILFDNDRAGIEAAQKLVDAINEMSPRKSRYIHLETNLLKIKVTDPADYIKKKSREHLCIFLQGNKIKLNNNQ
jgi:5S rRNA maturation endonuclease (ribonuclease M5)